MAGIDVTVAGGDAVGVGEEHPATLISIDDMAAVLLSQGKLSEAEPFCREALEKCHRVLGDDHPKTLDSVNNMGCLRAAQHKYLEAEGCFREALEKRRRVLGEEHPSTLESMIFLGGLLEVQNKLLEAVAIFSEGVVICRRAYQQPHPVAARLLRNSAHLLGRVGRLEEAREQAREAVAMYRDHPDLPSQEARHAAEVLAALDELIAAHDAEPADRQAEGNGGESGEN